MKILLCGVILVIVPILLGLLYTYFLKEEKNNLILAFVSGYIIELALFELIAIPITFLKVKFSALMIIWNVLLTFLSILSVILNFKRIKEIWNYSISQIKKIPIISILVVILVGLQVFVLFRYMHTDDDDAFYIGLATTTIYTDQINIHNPSKGNVWGDWQSRYVLSPFSVYIAAISEQIGFAPATVAHTILPIIFIPMMYMIYGLIGKKIFKNDKKSICLFLILLNIIYIFGNYSTRTNFTFALFRIWQGKAFMANIILPCIWYWFIRSAENKENHVDYIMLIILMIATCLPTSMGVVTGSITIAGLACVFAIKEKNIKYIWKYFFTCIPCLICGIIFLVL